MIKQVLFVLACVIFLRYLSEKMELSKKKNRKRSFVASEEEVKQEKEERIRQRNKDEFDVLVALCSEMKDKNLTPEWRQMLKRSSVVNEGRALVFVLFIPYLIKQMPPYKKKTVSLRLEIPFVHLFKQRTDVTNKRENITREIANQSFPLNFIIVDVNNNRTLSYASSE